jgi:ribosomal protein L12E/L44/L45/RPP1/RPP2
LRLLVLICFAAFPLPPLFLVVVAVAVTARLEVSCLEVARGAAAEEDDDDDDDEEEEEEEEEEEQDGKNGAVCCDE